MKTYNVYKHPVLGLEAVKVGFSWPAFFFGFIWMLVKKMYGLAILWLAMYVGLSLVEIVTDESPESGAQALVYLMLAAGYIALWLIPSFKGNRWREDNLSRRGYTHQIAVVAETPDAAIAEQARMI